MDDDTPRLLRRLRRDAAGTGMRVLLPEADDARILEAAVRARRAGLCRPGLIGDPDAVRTRAAELGVELGAVEVLDPRRDPRLDAMKVRLAEATARRRPELDVDALALDPLHYAAMVVRDERADAAVMGAVATTGDTLRAALRAIGVDPRYRVVTSCFLMALPDERVLVYADCGVVPRPDAEQLADIAEQAAGAYRRLVGGEPRVALLAFATKGSATHDSLEPVLEARRLLEARGVEFAFDGELQADAALVPGVARRKAPDSSVAGQANVLVFPDLNSGNIAYKLTERLAGARAIGPLLQGLARPVHDLSRGCSVEDVLDTLAIAALDAARRTT